MPPPPPMDDEWTRLGNELLELNPPTYRDVLRLMRELVEAERDLAAPEVRIFLELLRCHHKEPA